MNYAVILAAGSGTRFKGASVPKQFLTLGSTPMIVQTAQKFLTCPEIDRIGIVVSEGWLSHTKDLFRDSEFLGKIDFIVGGSSRQASLVNACRFVKEHFGERTWIISHDAARPFISLRIIQDNLQTGVRLACDTVLEAVDTIVESQDHAFISAIPDRNKMYQGQTPQSFVGADYIRAYEEIGESDDITDAAKLLLKSGIPVELVRGESYNIKITTDYDFSYAQFLMNKNDSANH
jgi:2-C-methyl-D-erythritol 4-phosphate cytidylyltransferase